VKKNTTNNTPPICIDLISVDELSGYALNYAVALAQGYELDQIRETMVIMRRESPEKTDWIYVNPKRPTDRDYDPVRNFNQSMPIVAHHHIRTEVKLESLRKGLLSVVPNQWVGSIMNGDRKLIVAFGETLAIAALRVYLKCCYASFVEIPVVLLEQKDDIETKSSW